MFTIDTLGSSSAGNCYLLNDGESRLIVELGLPWPKIKKGLGYNLSDVAGALVTHEHGDHAKAVKKAMDAGIDVYASKGTAEALGVVDRYRFQPLREGVKRQISGTGWTVIPFGTVHDAAEPMGFIIASLRCRSTIVFLTDTYAANYVFSGMTHLMIECNFSDKLLERRLAGGEINRSLYQRVRLSHLGLESVIRILERSELSRLQEVHLMHLSDENSDEKMFKDSIKELTGVPVYVCKK